MIIKELVGYGWGVNETKEVDPETGEERVTNRVLIFQDVGNPLSEVIKVTLDTATAEDMGGQLQGQPPKKRVEIVKNGQVPDAVLRKGGHNAPGGVPRG